MKSLFIALMTLAFTCNLYAAKPCTTDKYTSERVADILAEDADLEKLEMTDAKGVVTAFLMLGKTSKLAEMLFVCGTNTHLYYGDIELSSWVSEEGDVKTVSTFSDSTLSQDEGLLSAEVLTISKIDKEAKLKVFYMIYNLADQDVEDRGDLYLTLKLK